MPFLRLNPSSTFKSLALGLALVAAGNFTFTFAADATPALKPIKLVIVGDSTACNYTDADPAHRHGWGMHIQEYFQAELKVVNLALSGRSTKSFIKEGAWDKALAEKPDVVLIQFGHNDSHASTRPEATNAATDFRDNLRKYIDDTRAIGGTPILVTPMCRRTKEDALAPYADAMKIVATEKKVPLIDLHASSAQLYAKLGPAGTEELSSGDSTHFNAKGAQAMAALVMNELPAADRDLAPYLKPAATTTAATAKP